VKQIRKRFTYANVMSSIAVFLILGGATALAAGQLGKNSVGSKQLKKNAVTSAKVKNGSLLSADFKAGQLPKGATGPQGSKGEKGDAGPLLNTLSSGQTLRGSFNGGNGANAASDLVEASISYPFPLAANVVAHVIQLAEAPPSQCPGTVSNPQAQAGNLCIFVAGKNSAGTVGSYGTVDGSSDYRFGASVYARSPAATTVSEIWGTWAVTAP